MGSSQEILEQLKGGDLADLFKGLGSKDSKNSGGEEGSSLFKLLTGNGISAGTAGKKEGGNAPSEGESDSLKSIAALLGGDEKIASLLSMLSGGKDGKNGEKSGVVDLLKSQLFNDKGEMDLAKAGGSLGSLAVVASSLLGLKSKEKIKEKEETTADKSDDPMSFWRDISNQLNGKNPKTESESKKGKKGESKLSSLGKSIKEKVLGSEEKKSAAESEGKKFKMSDLNPLSLFKSKKGDTKKEEKGFFASISEKITGKNKKEVSSETGKDMKVEEKDKSKSKLSQQIDSAKTKLSSIFGKKSDKEGSEGKDSEKSGGMFSGLKKEFTNLKESFTKKEPQKKSEGSTSDSPKSPTGGESMSKTESNPVQTSDKSSSSSTSGSSSDKSSPSSAPKDGAAITPQDIQDIKSLLSALNTTLSGPLMIRDNKPFRPKSSMLE